MTVHEVRTRGAQALSLATALLQRARLASPTGGLWEAADVQWWSRKPRPSDDIDQVFWTDADGPVAGVLLTCWGETRWQCDPIRVSGVAEPGHDRLWSVVVEQVTAHASGDIEIPLTHDDESLQRLAEECGLIGDDDYGNAWMDISGRPQVLKPPAGFVVRDRSDSRGTPHPMSERNGTDVELRLQACSLYNSYLDLTVEASDGRSAGYALFWHDPVTQVGLIEPVRVEDEFARRGLARTMLTTGISRLAEQGTRRVKVGFGSDAGESLYRGLGFLPGPNDIWYEGRAEQLG